eukprot:96806_1
MQFMELKLEITISITDILDNYTHAIYKNFLTWNEYKANEDFKHNSIDWQCFVNENIAAMKSLLSELLDILEVVMTIFIGIIRQIIIMLLMTTFLHQAKIFYIKRMISTKRKLKSFVYIFVEDADQRITVEPVIRKSIGNMCIIDSAFESNN